MIFNLKPREKTSLNFQASKWMQINSFMSVAIFGVVIIFSQAVDAKVTRAAFLSQATSQHQQTRLNRSQSIVKIEGSIFQKINQQRRSKGLQPLKTNKTLTQVARSHSKEMAKHGFYDHRGKQGDTPRQRVEASGVQAGLVGENLVKFSQRPNPAVVAVQSWMRSSAHRRNILLPNATETGIGIWKRGETYYMTQIFVEPKM